MLVAYAIALVYRLVRDSWVLDADGKPSCIDFSWMWVSGTFAWSSNPARVYDHPAFSAARAILNGVDSCIFAANFFAYPPTYLFFTSSLGLMPYLIAFAAWMVATSLLYLTAVYVITPRSTAVIVALTPFPVLVNIVLGHNGFLIAGLIGLSLASMVRWPWLSGIFLGLLTFKPQIGILFPSRF